MKSWQVVAAGCGVLVVNLVFYSVLIGGMVALVVWILRALKVIH